MNLYRLHFIFDLQYGATSIPQITQQRGLTEFNIVAKKVFLFYHLRAVVLFSWYLHSSSWPPFSHCFLYIRYSKATAAIDGIFQ